MTEYEPGATCHSPRKTQLYISYKILQYFAAAQIVDSVPLSNLWNPIQFILHFIWQSNIQCSNRRIKSKSDAVVT
jgi:hypothetical protein